MIIIVNTMDKQSPKREISVSFEESQQITQALKAGVEFITIGTETINAKYIIGIIDGGGVMKKFKQLSEPKEDKTKIRNILDKMRADLKARGIIK